MAVVIPFAASPERSACVMSKNLETITCVPIYRLYEKDGWKVIKCQNTQNDVTFVATGDGLPYAEDRNINRNTVITMTGYWSVGSKYGTSFKVESFEYQLKKTKDATISYLSSLRCGFGPAAAEAVWKTFGDITWDVLDNQPERLIGVKYGRRYVSKKMVDKLKVALSETKKEREVTRLLRNANLSLRKVQTLLKAFPDEDVVDILKHDTYRICEVKGFSFDMVDSFALEQGVAIDNPARLREALRYTMDLAASAGHMCVPAIELPAMMARVANKNVRTKGVTEEICKGAINAACLRKDLRLAGPMLYSASRFEQEYGISRHIKRLMKSNKPVSTEKINRALQAYQEDNDITLAEKQKEAVISCFQNPVTIITGGPGTGKTTVTKAVLYVHKELFGEDNSLPCLLAPTGRAARRMTEQTGVEASTIHSAIGLRGDDCVGGCDCDGPLFGNIFIIDECSMMDSFVAYNLLQKIPGRTRVVFVGDPEQLPSVGAGNVLYEMIRSGMVPVTKLNVIYRQAQGNPIVENAQKMRHGDVNLHYAKKQFMFMEDRTGDPSRIEQAVCELYEKSIRAKGASNVALLCPYRHKSALNVNRFNKLLQERINPASPTKNFAIFNSKLFREGDRVMQTKNTDFAKNGDIGVIHSISFEADKGDPNKKTDIVTIEFNDDGNLVRYDAEQMENVDLAYCTTVHKSQGSEYSIVIMVVSPEHKAMLRRNLVYTGITRAKDCVIMVGRVEALTKAIQNNKTDKRYTMLGDWLYTELHEFAADAEQKQGA